MRFSIFKYLFLTIVLIGFQSTFALADWRSRIMDQYDLDEAWDRTKADFMQRKIQRFTRRISAIPKTKVLSDQEEEQCFQLYDDIDLARSTGYYSAFDLMFTLDTTFIFPDEHRFNDFDELNRPDREKNRFPSWLDYRAHDVIVRSNSYHRDALNSPESFLNLFKEIDKSQGLSPCYIDYTPVREKLGKLKSRVERDLKIRNQFLQFEEQVAGKSINDLAASDIEFLNSILADTEIALSEIRFAAYNTAGLLLIRSDDGKFFWSKDRENKQKAIYFWEYAALNGQSVDAMLNLFIHQGLIEKGRFLTIAKSFSPNLTLNKVGLFQLYSPRMQSYSEDDSAPTPQNTLRLASYYMRHPAFEWRQKNKLMHKVGILTYAGRNDLKKYVEKQEGRARQQHNAEKTAEKIALWATLIGTTAAALGQLSDGGSSPSTADDLFKGQMDHIDNVMVGAYAISLD